MIRLNMGGGKFIFLYPINGGGTLFGTQRKRRRRRRKFQLFTIIKAVWLKSTTPRSTSNTLRFIGAQQVAKVATAMANINIRRRFASDCRRLRSSLSLQIKAPWRAITMPILMYTINVIDNGNKYWVMNTSTVISNGTLNETRGNWRIHRNKSLPWNIFSLTTLNDACGADKLNAISQIPITVKVNFCHELFPIVVERCRIIHNRCNAINVIVNVDT